MRYLWLVAFAPMVVFAEDRVSQARKAQGAVVEALFRKGQVAYPPKELYLRAFKHEKELEVWAGPEGAPLTLVQTIPFCYASGDLGPKRRQGDLQVPEGFYVIDRFNPASNFLLSMRVSYPNPSDRVRGVPGKWGGDIYIHGDCVSIGCIAIDDGPIQALYLMAWDSSRAGRTKLPIHIFPRRLDEAGLEALADHPQAALHLGFWKELQPAFLKFEKTRRPPRVVIDPRTGGHRVP